MVHHPFHAIEAAPADPILGLNDLFNKDSNPHKVNLTLGIYQDDNGVNPVLKSVKQAEKLLLERENTKSYLAIGGREEYGRAVRELVFGTGHLVPPEGCAVTMHTPGGTGALRLGAEFLASQFPRCSVWVSDPTWANHRAIFAGAGLRVESYPYLDQANQRLRMEELLESLAKIPEGDVVLLHGCCHNPSGLDPTPEQWEELAGLFAGRALIPFFDLAYQGLGEGLEQDGYAPRAFGRKGIGMLVAGSFSKSFSLYRERVGSLTLVGSAPEEVNRAQSRLKSCARATYSNPPAHGGLIVETVLGEPELQALWLEELDGMRERILSMRSAFVEGLKSMGAARDWDYIKTQKGMFSLSGISREEVGRLREEFSIYILENGRINLAGMTPANMDYLCNSIAKVINS